LNNKGQIFPAETKFLVTGGAGFIGSNLCEALLDMGYAVRCLDDFSTGKHKNVIHLSEKPNFVLLEGDICNFETCMTACEGVDYVSHQAAWGSVPRSIELPLQYEEINIKGTLNMLEAARLANVKRFVYASSSSVYGDSPDLPKREGAEGEVFSPYALTKKVNEEYARLYFIIYGLETVGLRYFNVFGRRQDPHGSYAAVIPKFIKALLNGESPTINGDGTQSRDFTFIENVIEANIKAMLAPRSVAGEVFNIACGGREYLINLYNTLCDLLEKDIKPQFGTNRPGDIKHSIADIQKARNLLGYEPEYDFNRGIRLALDWYKKNL